jgi:hypothetical protein
VKISEISGRKDWQGREKKGERRTIVETNFQLKFGDIKKKYYLCTE